jgi:hypothetical protein
VPPSTWIGSDSHIPESHAPFDWLAIGSLDNAIQLHHVGPHHNLEMRRYFFGGRDDADVFRSTAERATVTLSKLDDVWNVTPIRRQTRKTIQRQDNLFKCDWTSLIVMPEARYPKYRCLEIAQDQLCPFGHARCPDCLCNRRQRCHDHPLMTQSLPMPAC